MTKLLAIIRREYLQRVRTRLFVAATLLGPLIMFGFALVPALVFTIKAGGATRVALVDQTGKLYKRARDAIMRAPDLKDTDDEDTADDAGGKVIKDARRTPAERARVAGKAQSASYAVEQFDAAGRSLEEVRRALDARVKDDQLDAYVILPADVFVNGKADYYGRNLGDVMTISQLRNRLSSAVVEQRMFEAGIDQSRVRELSRPVALATKKSGGDGSEGGGGTFILAFVVGFFIYFTIIMYGQTIMSAVVEEKTTRVTEMLFSSVHTFTLMTGKLIGVSLVALTQYLIWTLAFAALTVYGYGVLAVSGVTLPQIAPSVFVYFLLFFLLGYFVYATLYVLIGSMVTTAQEGGQVSMPVLFMLIAGFYMAFPVIRSPNSSFAFWVSMVPFFSPITMLVRIVTETPPFWQIALSLAIGFATVMLLVWLAARIYRVGMLMYGKRASIPEVLRWVRQA